MYTVLHEVLEKEINISKFLRHPSKMSNMLENTVVWKNLSIVLFAFLRIFYHLETTCTVPLPAPSGIFTGRAADVTEASVCCTAAGDLCKK